MKVWVSVKDELPPIGELVLVSKGKYNNVVDLDNITNKGTWLRGSYKHDPCRSDINYWMRIPQRPKNNDKELNK